MTSIRVRETTPIKMTGSPGSVAATAYVKTGIPGPAGPVGPIGPAVMVAPGDMTVTDNNDGTATLATAVSNVLTDNNDGTATIAA